MEYLDTSIVRATRHTEPPRNRSRTGYGNRIPTSRELKLDDGRWHRVYCISHGTGGTCYVLVGGRPHYLQTGWSENPFEIPLLYWVLGGIGATAAVGTTVYLATRPKTPALSAAAKAAMGAQAAKAAAAASAMAGYGSWVLPGVKIATAPDGIRLNPIYLPIWGALQGYGAYVGPGGSFMTAGQILAAANPTDIQTVKAFLAGGPAPAPPPANQYHGSAIANQAQAQAYFSGGGGGGGGAALSSAGQALTTAGQAVASAGFSYDSSSGQLVTPFGNYDVGSLPAGWSFDPSSGALSTPAGNYTVPMS